MTTTRAVKRSYRSPLRVAQARATRGKILAAATELFVAAGYGATSIDAIADAAGVSRATVFNVFGDKPTLLKAAYDVALVGDDEPVALPDRADSKAIRAEPDPARYLERYAGLITELGGRVSGIYEAVRGAAGTDPEVRPVWEKILAGAAGRRGARGRRHGVEGSAPARDRPCGRCRRRLDPHRPRPAPPARRSARLVARDVP